MVSTHGNFLYTPCTVRARAGWRSDGKTVVFTNGCYDILHPGHVRLLEKARSLGDVLILALNTDASVARLKGPSRPLIPKHERARMALALEAVDAVTFFDEDTPRELIAEVLPGHPYQRRGLGALHRRPRRSGSRGRQSDGARPRTRFSTTNIVEGTAERGSRRSGAAP